MEGLANLGINFKGIILYIVNFGLVAFILAKFLYKPILHFLDERKKQIEDSISEAERLKEGFQKEIEKIHDEKEKTQKKLTSEIDQLKKYVEKKRVELTAEMELARAQMLEKAQTDIDEKMNRIMSDAEKRTLELIKKTILDVLQHGVPEEVIEKSIHSAWSKLK